jgi:tryptophanase
MSCRSQPDYSDDEVQALFQPYKMKVVENIKMSTREDRIKWVEEAGFNLYNLRSDQIMIDLLTDSGVSALSDNQAAKLLTGDESYAGSSSFFNFKAAVQEITNYKHVIPVHQGRGAENIFFSLICDETKLIPNNCHYITTRMNIEIAKGSAIDLVCEEAKDMYLEAPFKGSFDFKIFQILFKFLNIECFRKYGY